MSTSTSANDKMNFISSQSFNKKTFTTEEKPKDVRHNNILAAKTLADIRTSLDWSNLLYLLDFFN